jgi:hypothetical protein
MLYSYTVAVVRPDIGGKTRQHKVEQGKTRKNMVKQDRTRENKVKQGKTR